MGEAEIVSLGLAYAKKNIKNLINMYVYYVRLSYLRILPAKTKRWQDLAQLKSAFS